MHAVAIRGSLVHSDPTLGRRIFDEFEAARQVAISQVEVTQAPKITLPWPHAAVSETRALMGQNFWPYGVRANRHVLQTQLNWSYLDGLQMHRVNLDALFVEDCLDT
jgi:4,5-dihydroxyphthalate decarboxylase